MRRLWSVGGIVLVALVGTGVYQMYKPLPVGVRRLGAIYHVPPQSVRFLADRTFVDGAGRRQSEQQIFNEVLSMIKGARRYVLIDMFLYNEFQGTPPETTRALVREMTEALVAQQQQYPDMNIIVVSDPLNTVYGGATSPHFEQLQRAGITVVLTDLTKLRDSNPLYSSIWRLTFRWLGNNNRFGFLPHPFGANRGKVTLRSWLALFNFKANHRKLIVADELQPDGTLTVATLLTSANPHDGSSAHSNVALKISDHIWRDAQASELAVGDFSGATLSAFSEAVEDKEGEVDVQLLTEGAIRERVVELLNATERGDTVDMVMFYLSERSVVKALLAAADRGVIIRLILDPNKDAFGHTKNGVPNRSVAHELVKKSNGTIQVRWCDTHGEQCHSKMVLWRIGGRQVLTAGSANFTRRNIGDYNLETNVLVAAEHDIPAITAARGYFEELWTNANGRIFTTPYETYADDSKLKTILYRLQEATGLSSF